MKRRKLYVMVSGLVVVITAALVIALGIFPGSLSNTTTDELPNDLTDSPLVMAPEQEVTSNPSSPEESIKVHGHWIIEVNNPDGSLAERREFDNFLTSWGIETLAGVMGRQYDVGGWTIFLWVGDPSPFLITYPRIVEDAFWPVEEEVLARTLTVTVAEGDTTRGDEKLILYGTAVADQAGTIFGVNSQLGRAPGSGVWEAQGSTTDFAQTTFDEVSLASGQQVSVTVEISFISST